jgi:fatty acid desaturase
LLHHEHPSIPWFALPAHWRALRQDMLTNGNGPVYRSYVEVALRFATRPQHGGPHPIQAASPS